MTTFGIIAEIFRQAGSELWRHKLRSFLTMFGIGWGICALALIMASGEGFREGQLKSMEQIGYRIVLVFGGRTEMQVGGQRAGRYIRLYQDDVLAIREQCPAVGAVSAEIKTWNVPVESNFNAGRFLILGVDSEYLKIRNLPVAVGRNIGWNDVENFSRVCVLGDSVRKQLFEDQTGILGSRVRINGLHYHVVGLMGEKDQNSSNDGWDNDKILIPTSSLRRDCPSDPSIVVEKRLDVIVYQPRSIDRWQEAQEQVRRTLGRIHNFDPRDEAALPMWDTIKSATLYDDIFGSINLFLGAIALVTLSLGGIGVMNTMFTSVVERTSEIGLKKALGARQLWILGEFFLEGLVLAFLSGVIGILIVLGLASIVNSFPMPEYFSGLPIDAVLVFKLALALGMVAVLAAIPPAWRAARMDPVVAMNYEK
jgi:putative ABC transport system permease protein